MRFNPELIQLFKIIQRSHDNMSPKPILYELPCSPSVRAVKMLAKALHLQLELKQVDLFKGEHKSESFLKINPTHTVPTLDDNGTLIWDSHAIMTYLVDKYGENDALYPKNLIKRTEINQLLFFDVSVWGKMLAVMCPIVFDGAERIITKQQVETLEASYESIERLLQGKTYLTGNNVTIADISIVTTMTSLNLIAPINPGNYSKMAVWMKKMEALPCYEPNVDGIKQQRQLFESYIKLPKSLI